MWNCAVRNRCSLERRTSGIRGPCLQQRIISSSGASFVKLGAKYYRWVPQRLPY